MLTKKKRQEKNPSTYLYKGDNQIHCWPLFCCCKFLLDIDVRWHVLYHWGNRNLEIFRCQISIKRFHSYTKVL